MKNIKKAEDGAQQPPGYNSPSAKKMRKTVEENKAKLREAAKKAAKKGYYPVSSQIKFKSGGKTK